MVKLYDAFAHIRYYDHSLDGADVDLLQLFGVKIVQHQVFESSKSFIDFEALALEQKHRLNVPIALDFTHMP